MKWINLILAGIFFLGASPQRILSGAQNGDRASFYSAIQSTDLAKIDAELKSLKSKTGSHTAAFEGALQMKKSGLLTNAPEKLELFKSGRAKLEDALAKDKGNAELHFLRLIVQENAPKMLHYDSNITEDAAFISSQFVDQDPTLKQEILNYRKTSPSLKKADLHE